MTLESAFTPSATALFVCYLDKEPSGEYSKVFYGLDFRHGNFNLGLEYV